MKPQWVMCAVTVAALVGCSSTAVSDKTEYKSKHGVTVTVTAPHSGEVISSPVKVRGRVPGSWSFEASFGIEIQDTNHKKVSDGFATIKGDWMTEKPVGFTASVSFKAPVTGSGYVVLRRANPSAESDQADSVSIPVKFK